MRYLVFALFLISFNESISQSEIKGIVKDSTGELLPGATVLLLDAKDSVMQEFASTDDRGLFRLKADREKRYLLQITFLGLQSVWEAIYTGNAVLDLGTIIMMPTNTLLPTLEVLGEYDLMKIGRDTVEYNAKAFKVQPGAVVEDLLKRLPGLEVQRDGSIKAYGEDVQNVLVDGKEFFGKDTRIATKNLEADAIDKVQVFDKKSDMAEFTGVDDGRDEKTINLKLKANRKNGYFGTAELAGGTSDRFKSKFNLNKFSGDSRMSIIGLGNNINDQSFSMNNYIDFMGGIGSMMSGGGNSTKLEISGGGLPIGGGAVQGIQRSLAGGLNFNKRLNAKTELNASYLLNSMKNHLVKSSERQSLLSEQAYNSDEDEDRISNNDGHNITFRLRSKLDSFQHLIVRGTGSWNDNRFNSDLNNLTYLTKNNPVNQSMRQYFADGLGYSFNTSLTWQRKFRKAGRSISWTGSGKKGLMDREGHLDALNQYYIGQPYIDTLLQDQLYTDRSTQWDARISYTEPLGKKQFLELSGYASNNRNKTITDFYDITDPGITLKNNLLSTSYNRGYEVLGTGLRMIKNREKYHFSYGMMLQQSLLQGRIIDAENPIKVKYTRLLPEANLQYELGTAHHINFDYSTRVQEPSLQQIQPTSNNVDPLNIYIGNASLRPEYQHILNSSYFRYEQFTFTSIFGSLGASYTQNKITDLVEIDSLYRRIIQPVNVKDEKALRSNLEFSTPIRPLKIVTKIRWRSQLANSILFINSEKNKVNRFGNAVTLSLENRRKEKIDALVGIKLSGSQTNYSEQEALNQTYKETNLFSEITYTPNERWAIHSEFDYLSYTQSNQTDKLVVPLWKVSLTRYLGKDQRLKAMLTVFDILDRNKGISRNSQLNYLELQRTNALGRYIMLGMAYSIRGFKKQRDGIQINISNGDDRR